MKLLTIVLNVIVSPLILIAFVYYFKTQDIREAVLVSLMITTLFTTLQLFVKVLKVLFSTLTFNLVKAIKNSAQIILSIGILILYWLAYYFVWGSNFTLNI